MLMILNAIKFFEVLYVYLCGYRGNAKIVTCMESRK